MSKLICLILVLSTALSACEEKATSDQSSSLLPVDRPQSDTYIRETYDSLINGHSATSANDFWLCADSADREGSLTIEFYEDGNGTSLVGEQLRKISWIANGPYLDLYVQGNYFAQLDNVVLSDAGNSLAMNHVSVDGSMSILACHRVVVYGGH